ncbi:hypothetical protein RUM43_006862 [Polyplax serrata]|uniref:Tektin n=1 Tax=Polyplax serrata TaxID=468196 RepID=A0AAN8S553_POLSC
MDSIVQGSDKHQSQNTARLEERVKDVRDCKDEIEGLVRNFREEIVLLTETKIKLKFSLPALKMPESIAGECIERRTTRIEPDLVKDDVEVELVKELAMIKNVRHMCEETLKEIDRQIQANKSCKNQLELTWSDKKETCTLDSINASLRNSTPIIMYHLGAARFPGNQSSSESWALYNATLINTARDELAKSQNLRKTAEENIVEQAVRDLRKQADKVQECLLKRIDEADSCRQMFENELQDVLRQIVDAESLYDGLIRLQRQLEYNTKVVQTRLDNRLKRPRVENCRDSPQYGLFEEIRYLNDSKSKLKKQIDDIDKTVSKLYEARSNLEFVIATKKKSLYIDQQRCMAYREKYPDAATLLSGTSF